MRRYWNPEIETMPRGRLRDLQTQKLKRQLAYVVANSPFYARKFSEHGFDPGDVQQVEDLRGAPFTTKEELRASQESVPPLGDHAAVDVADTIRIHSSSGTTGRPSYVGITDHDWEVWTETVSRVYYAEGVRPDDVVIHGFGLGFFVGGLPLKDAIENIGATFVPIGTGASDRLVSSLRALGGTALTCTPSYARYLADYVVDRLGMEPAELGLERLMLGAEPGGSIPAVRDRLADAYQASVVEGIGNADLIPVYAGMCEEADGNHVLAPDHLLLELIDPDSGESLDWEDGAEGELVATHLDRECVPLVRFRVSDRMVVQTSPCPCGRTSPRLTCIGRTDDMLIVAGVNVWPSAVQDVVAGFGPRTTGHLQILVPSSTHRIEPPLRIQVEYGPEVSAIERLREDLEREIRDRLIVTADVDLVPPETLPRYEMKARLLRRVDDAAAVVDAGT